MTTYYLVHDRIFKTYEAAQMFAEKNNYARISIGNKDFMERAKKENLKWDKAIKKLIE